MDNYNTITAPNPQPPKNQGSIVGYSQNTDAGFGPIRPNIIPTLNPAELGTNRTFFIQENDTLIIDDGLKFTGKEVRLCLKFLLEQVRQEYPEEFI